MLSKFNSEKIISNNNSIVTIARDVGGCMASQHAIIFVERILESTKTYLCEKVHLTGQGSSRGCSLYNGNGSPKGAAPYYYSSEATIEIKNLTERRGYDDFQPRYIGDAHSYCIEASKVQSMIEYAKNQKSIMFNIAGHHNFFNVLQRMTGKKKTYNCVSWALEILKIAGINIKPDGEGFNLMTVTSKQLKNPTTTEFEIKELCEFARDGNTKGILLNYDNSFNVNQLTSYACSGPVESFLGDYSPLALAIGHGKLEVVKLLIESYNADIDFKSGRKRNYDALKCAEKSFLFSIRSKDDKLKILEFIKSHKCKLQEVDFIEEPTNRSGFYQL